MNIGYTSKWVCDNPYHMYNCMTYLLDHLEYFFDYIQYGKNQNNPFTHLIAHTYLKIERNQS